MTGTVGAYDVTGLRYDLSGNLTGLNRRDEGSALVDALSLDYEAGPGSGASSRLTEVQDAAGALHAWDAASGAFDYDANGAMTEAPAPYGLAGAVYDERGLPVRLDLAGGAAACYRYSLGGARTFKQVTGADGTPGEAEHYLLDAGAALGVVRGGQIAYWNVALPSGEVVGRHEADGARRYYLKDRLGSVRAVVDGSGGAVETRDHYPFGLRMPGRGLTTGTPTKEGFTGHELDGETGLVYAGARYLMPALGRWTTPDPLADAFLAHSPYNYAENNPTNLTDPTGLFAESGPSAITTRYYDEDGNLIYDDGIDNGLEVYTSWDVIKDHASEDGVDWDGVRNDPASNTQVVDQGKYWGWVGGVSQRLMDKYDGGVKVTADNEGNISYQTTSEAIWGLMFESAASLAGEWVLLKTTGAILRATSNGRVRGVERLLRKWLGDDYRVITNSSGDPIFMSKNGTKKFRIDFRNSQGDKPHMHLEVFKNGKWRDAVPSQHRLYPNN